MLKNRKIENIVRRVLREFSNDKKYRINEIKYFSPNGIKKVPNGHQIQKAGFIKECFENSKKFKIGNNQYFINENFNIIEDFTINERSVHPNQYGLSDYRGGMIIFSTEVNSLDVSENKIYNFLMKKIKSLKNRLFSKSKLSKVINTFNSTEKKLGDSVVDDYIGAFSIGNFFSGRYIGDNEKVFDESSLSIEINGISTNGLMYLAEEIAKEFDQETVLVKDLNVNKIYLMNQERGGDYDISNLNQKSV
jgi:hypothetical protein